MSSYLVAFVVGNLTSIQKAVPGGLNPETSHLVRVWGTPDRYATLGSFCAVSMSHFSDGVSWEEEGLG